MDLKTRVSALVLERPARARVFERHRIDYCCGGSRSLAEACLARGLDPERVLAELSAVESDPGMLDVAAMRPSELVDHIEATHHAFVKREIPRIRGLFEKVVRAHGDLHPELSSLRARSEELFEELEPHLVREEEIIFPAIRVAESERGAWFGGSDFTGPIAALTEEHEVAGALLASLRTMTNDYRVPPDACPTWVALYDALAGFERDLHQHVHAENNVLFPRITH